MSTNRGRWCRSRQRPKISAFDDIARLIEPTLHAMGFDIVAVRMHGGDRPRLQVMAEPQDSARGMTVEDCADISHAMSAILDVSDPIKGAYTLEVSSPGIDRPLVKLADFARFAGARGRVEIEPPLDGRRRFLGLLGGIEGEAVMLDVDGGDRVAIPFASIRKAKLVVDLPLPAKPAPKPRARPRGHEPGRRRDDATSTGASVDAAPGGRARSETGAKHKGKNDGA